MPIRLDDLLAPLKLKMQLDDRQQEVKARQAEMFYKRVEFENKQNNKMLDLLWKAATNEGTPKAVFDNIRGMAENYTQTMTNQQKLMLDTTVTRGLFSRTDRLSDEFDRIYGKRPQVMTEELNQANFTEYAEQKVSQVEWDYSKRAYLAGGKDKLPEASAPQLIPIGSFSGEEGKVSDIYAYRNSVTGLVQTLDTSKDIPADLFNKAKKDGFGPTMMADNDFIPFDFAKSQVVTEGDKKLRVIHGISLKDGNSKILKLPLGDVADSGSRSTGKAISPNAVKVINWMNGAESGVVEDKSKAGAYSNWLERAEKLKTIEIEKRGERPAPGSNYMRELKQLQLDWNTQFPGTIPVPRITEVEATGLWPFEYFTAGYYSESAQWNPLQVDGQRQIVIGNKPVTLWYKDNVDNVGEHVWYNAYGEPLDQLFGLAPNSVVNSEAIK